MEPDSVTRCDLEKGLADLRQGFEAKLERVQERVLTALYGFVNGASARMEWLEGAETSLLEDVARLEQRLQACEQSGPRASTKKPN
jgi:hypothetical protein